MKIFKIPLFIVLSFFMFQCSSFQEQNADPKGLWRLELDLGEGKPPLPFFITMDSVEGNLKAVIWNGDESMMQGDVFYRKDSLVIKSAIYNSALVLKQRMNTMNGFWYDYSRAGNYKIPVTGKYNLNHRFRMDSLLSQEADGQWEVTFSPGKTDSYKAIGRFSTDSFSLSGTFITETGDYRYLDGGFDGNHFKLSTFDGAHAFLFDAIKNGDSIAGTFYSGNHYQEKFTMTKNDSFELTNPYTLTKATESKVEDIVGTDLDGNAVFLKDLKVDKGVLLQVMGSWCPNCYDEGNFLTENYGMLQEKGITVLALAFEKMTGTAALEHLKIYKERMGIPYPIWYMGSNEKDEASKMLPFLDKLRSYPTLIILDKNLEIQSIHTGYYGPSTGELYALQNQRFLKTIDQLVASQ